MFEFHGWATICFTADHRERDDAEALRAAAVESVREHIERLGYTSPGHEVSAPSQQVSPALRYSGNMVSAAKANVLMDLRVMNGQYHVLVAGFKNHAAPVEDELLGLFRFISEVAPGSYGLLYTFNDEDPVHDNEFRVYVMARSRVTEHADLFLSPFVPTVEDPYSGG